MATRRPRRRTGPTDLVRALVHDRDHGQCVRCGSRSSLTIHHRVNRGMGGAREPWINEPQNLLLACTFCNTWFEDNPRQSYAHGWKLRRPMLPADMTVRYSDGHEWALFPDGTRAPVTKRGLSKPPHA